MDLKLFLIKTEGWSFVSTVYREAVNWVKPEIFSKRYSKSKLCRLGQVFLYGHNVPQNVKQKLQQPLVEVIFKIYWDKTMTSPQSPITTDSFCQIFLLRFLNIAKHRSHLRKGLEKLQPLEILSQVAEGMVP